MTRARAIAALTAEPWRAAAFTIAAYRGLGYVLGLVPSPASEDLLPYWLRVVLLLYLAVGGALGLAGVASRKVAIEAAGLVVLGPATFAYAVVVAFANLAHGSLTIVTYVVIALCCFLRLREIRRNASSAAQLIRRARELSGGAA